MPDSVMWVDRSSVFVPKTKKLDNCVFALVVVERPSSSKLLLPIYMKGVTLCLIPLLSLGTNQVNEAMIKTHDDPSKAISAIHLDKLCKADLDKLQVLLAVADAGTATVLYSSLQFLTEKHSGFVNNLLWLRLL